jgi:hypothetical protein
MCNLGLELKQNAPGHYAAYSRFACLNTAGLGNSNPLDILTKRSLPNTEPDATILTGIVEKGTIRLHADKTADIDNCPMTDLAITPFGTDAVIAEWNDCQNGKLLLQREAR